MVLLSTGAGCNIRPPLNQSGSLVAADDEPWHSSVLVNPGHPLTLALDFVRNDGPEAVTLQSAELLQGDSDFPVKILEVGVAQPERSLDGGMMLGRPRQDELGSLAAIQGAAIRPGRFLRPYVIVYVVSIPRDGKAQIDGSRITYTQGEHRYIVMLHNQTNICGPRVEDERYREWCRSDVLEPRPTVATG